MEEKLKLALEPIHWSLLLKAVLVAATWYFWSATIAWWLLLLIYFVPPYKSGVFLLAFGVLAFLLLVVEASLVFAVFLGVAVYCLIGVKNLVLIDRATAYQVLATLLFLFLWLSFFSVAGGFYSNQVFMYLLVISLLFYFFSWRTLILREASGEVFGQKKIVLALSSFLIFQWGLVVYFLPLDFHSQTALALLGTALLLEILLQYLSGQLQSKNLVLYFSIFFPLLILILIFQPAGLL